MLERGLLTMEELALLKQVIKQEIKAAIAFADASPFPTADELFEDNYEQKDYPFLE